MWWIPVGTGVLIGGLLLFLNYLNNRRLRRNASNYRMHYEKVMTLLEGVVVRMNALGSLAAGVSDKTLLHYYESSLRLFENLLETIAQVPHFGSDLGSLRSAYLLAKQVEKKGKKAEEAFRRHIEGQKVDYESLLGVPLESNQAVVGCYFCSRPYERELFKVVRVRIAETPMFVYGCASCRDKLRESKRINVLFFEKDGKPVHWSKVKEYDPAKDYWQMQRRGPVYKALNFGTTDRFDS